MWAGVSYLAGRPVRFGVRGSVYIDTISGPIRHPTAAFDLKTGGARLTAARRAQIRCHLPAPLIGSIGPIEDVVADP